MNKKAVVWVSTVLYILISLVIIGIVLTAVNPRINSARDKSIIENTIILLNELDENINYANQTQGTKIKKEFKLSRGNLIINAKENKIIWELEKSAYQYSEPGINIKIGKINALTTTENKVILTLEYSYDLQYQKDDKSYIIQAATNPYTLWIEKEENYLNFYLNF